MIVVKFDYCPALINNRLNTTHFLHLLHTYSSCQSEVPVTIEHGQQALLKLFLNKCVNIKALLRDIEDSFIVGYLCQYSDTTIELLVTTGQ